MGDGWLALIWFHAQTSTHTIAASPSMPFRTHLLVSLHRQNRNLFRWAAAARKRFTLMDWYWILFCAQLFLAALFLAMHQQTFHSHFSPYSLISALYDFFQASRCYSSAVSGIFSTLLGFGTYWRNIASMLAAASDAIWRCDELLIHFTSCLLVNFTACHSSSYRARLPYTYRAPGFDYTPAYCSRPCAAEDISRQLNFIGCRACWGLYIRTRNSSNT